MADFEDDFSQILDVNVTDDIIFPVKDVNASVGQKGRWITLAQLLGSAVRKVSGVVASLEVTDLTAAGLIVGAGQELNQMLSASDSVAIPTISAGTGDDATMTVTGAATGDLVLVDCTGTLPDGLILRGYVSAANTVTIEAFNATSGSITGASYTIRAVCLRFA